MNADARLFAPATARNREFILAVLRHHLPASGTVLEIGSGSGEHAVFFAARLPGLRWQPSETEAGALASIRGWIVHAGVANVADPLLFDATAAKWPLAAADAVVAINVIHYSPWETTPALLDGVARLLPPGGVLYLYGPYRRDGAHTAPSNEAFDGWLKERDPRFGVRDLEAVVAEAAARGLTLAEVAEMPANNLSVVFRRA
ncbi:DUF938 domain-containing protein [Azoarcus sp. TTM-91]|uniref:DUF938 domain-containing protein n=1 Tax=Azoarcus sp. TTM-91 TaxID=2691581 RepID=UPI00145E03EA|nr:DUF938 domain-containing protein [Azoarcus sp. TTM-91]NMG34939.1 DUF938 domain-containing protein [Azoarcus sp. TTM-91]